MANFKVYKEVSALPGTLEPNALYLVRIGTGFDLYCSDVTGSVAHKINNDYSLNYPAGQIITSGVVSNGLSTYTNVANAYLFFPFIPTGNLRASNQAINVTTALAGSEVTLFLFSSDSSTGLFLDQIFHINPLSIATTGGKFAVGANFKTSSGFETRQLNTFVFKKNTLYWIGYWSSGAGAVRSNPLGNLISLGLLTSGGTAHATHYRAVAPLNTALSDPFSLSPVLTSGVLPSVAYNTVQV
jgi:hypothetical protein